MPEIVVTAKSRTEVGKNCNRRLRQQGLIPGILYGNQKKTALVAVSPKDVVAVIRSPSGTSTLFDLEYEGARRKVILKEFQAEPARGELLHADFFEVALDKPIEVKVRIELTGTPVGVKTQGGLLDFVTRELDVECLPLEIPDKIVIDVTPLEIGKHLRVSDLSMPPKVKVLTEHDVVVVHVVVKREEEEAPAVEAVAEGVAGAAEPEVIKKGKAEGEGTGEEKAEKPDKPEKPDKKAEKPDKKDKR
jgi:large subunit ribosomal protein L25